MFNNYVFVKKLLKQPALHKTDMIGRRYILFRIVIFLEKLWKLEEGKVLMNQTPVTVL